MLRLKEKGRLLFDLAGWLVFTASACGFLVSTYMARDAFAFCGSLLFLLGCLMFALPLVLRLVRQPSPGHGPLPRHDACLGAQCDNNARKP